jgi:isopenicillin N synthase-like dioxygenase
MVGVVTLSYADLVAGKDLTNEIYEAYGPDGLGALTVSDIPTYDALRDQLLSRTYTLAHLPEEMLSKYENSTSLYNVGWSRGKEKMGDKPDFAKGSYYANPVLDQPGSDTDRLNYPSACSANIWPSEADAPGFEEAFKALGKLQYEVCLLVAMQVDALMQKRLPQYPDSHLHTLLDQAKRVKGRALHYYPLSEADGESEDSWIGWHNDSGFLTTLTAAQFYDEATGDKIENPDPEGGLYAVNRQGDRVRVKIPVDHLAIQCGECLQVLTGGVLVATPHCVRASRAPASNPGLKIGRTTFPCFVDAGIHAALAAPPGVSREDVLAGAVQSKVPPLADRWTGNEQTFAEFLEATFKQYYTWHTA